MKCVLLKDHHADVKNIPAYTKPLLKFWNVERIDPKKGKVRVPVPYFPAGTEFTHDVVGFITRGMAAPADEEARQACGFTDAELKKMQNVYNRFLAGIDEADVELFDMGVIVGYDLDGNYKHGPNWDAYMEARGGQELKPAGKVDEGI